MTSSDPDSTSSSLQTETAVSPRPVQTRTDRRRRLLRGTLILLGCYIGLCGMLAWETVRPKPHHFVRNPHKFGLPYENIAFHSADGTRLSGWLIPAASTGKGVIVCCHGVDGTRLTMLEPARILHAAGYAVVLFDFRARGESGGSRSTLGYRETEDLLAAVAWVQTRPDLKAKPIGVLGESMGGAVALMGTARCSAIRCVVAESPFARLDHAVDNHFWMFLGPAGPVLGIPTRMIGERMIGKNCAEIAPIEEIGRIAPRPILLIEDEEDRLCPATETQALYHAAGSNATLWTVPGAGHIGAIQTAHDDYARHLIAFFDNSFAASPRAALR